MIGSKFSKFPISNLRRAIIMITLVAAGEGIFLLPFVLVRVFRPTILDVFDITNLQLGMAFSAYGTVAMIAYFFGGPIADQFSAKKLMAIALALTSLGGLVFASIPEINHLIILYGFWGLTTILIFWAALIKVTRIWGGENEQGKAYGLLDGGRGLMAALMATLAVAIFSILLPVDVSAASIEEKRGALISIIQIISLIVFLLSILVYFTIPEINNKVTLENSSRRISVVALRDSIKRPSIWLQALIVVCAYVAYKGTDDFSLYVRDAFGYDDVEAAKIASISLWVRPFAAVAAGFLADRISSSIVIIIGFAIIVLGSLYIALGFLTGGVHLAIIATVITTSIGIHALRGVYFALFQEAKVPLAFTGSAVGIVSFIGYTPDIFMGPLMGYLIDSSPGKEGHQHVFLLLATFAFAGLLASLVFRRITKRNHQ